MENSMYANEVRFRGTIVNKYEAGQFTRITLGIYERGKGGTVIRDFPTVYCMKDESGKTVADDFMLHDYVEIIGHVSARLQNIRRGTEEDIRVLQQFVADEMKEGEMFYPNETEVGKGRGIRIPMNVVHLKGTVEDAIDGQSGVGIIRLNAMRGTISNICSIRTFQHLSKNVRPGDVLNISARAKTSTNTYKDRDHVEQTIHLRDIVAVQIKRVEKSSAPDPSMPDEMEVEILPEPVHTENKPDNDKPKKEAVKPKRKNKNGTGENVVDISHKKADTHIEDVKAESTAKNEPVPVHSVDEEPVFKDAETADPKADSTDHEDEFALSPEEQAAIDMEAANDNRYTDPESKSESADPEDAEEIRKTNSEDPSDESGEYNGFSSSNLLDDLNGI